MLLVCLFTSLYNSFHYFMPTMYRARFFSAIEILRFNIMMLFVSFYLRMASEELFKRKGYLCFKRVLLGMYFIFTCLMLCCGIYAFIELTEGHIRPESLCIKIYFVALRWGPLLATIVFLVFACLIHQRINKLYM